MGDGSAYPYFFYDEDVAYAHQRMMAEGWGEDCVSSVAIEHEGDSIVFAEAQTREEFVEEALKKLARCKTYATTSSYYSSEAKQIKVALTELGVDLED